MLAAIGITYWRPLRRVRRALGFDYLISTGHGFLILGYILGLAFVSHSRSLVDDVGPIVAFVAGWVGFATGMRFEYRVLRSVPLHAFRVALWPALGAAIVTAATSVVLLTSLSLSPNQVFSASLVLGAAAASSGPTLAAILRGRRAGRASHVRPLLNMIEFSAGVDDLLVLVLAGLAFAIFRPEGHPINHFGFLGITLGGGAVLGLITWLFLGGRSADEDERLLLGLAMLAFVAGFAAWLKLSPVAVSAIAAMVLANLPGNRMDKFFSAIRRVERPAVVILMTVIGFHISGKLHWIVFPLVFVITVGRLAVKHLAGQEVAGVLPEAPGLSTTPGWADGLASQGILGLLIALSLFQIWYDQISRSVLAAVAIGGVINEVLAPWLLLRLLRKMKPPRYSLVPKGPL